MTVRPIDPVSLIFYSHLPPNTEDGLVAITLPPGSSVMDGFGLSARGAANVAAIWPRISKAVEEREQLENPVIDMSTSENMLIREELIELYKKSVYEGLCNKHLSYPNGFNGDQDLIDSLAGFFNQYFKPFTPVDKQHIVVAPGVAFSLDALLYNICEAGDGILIPAPCWNGFDWLVNVRAGVHPIVARVSNLDDVFVPSKVLESLELAFYQSSRPIKGLLFTNPQNPLGQCYSVEMLEKVIKFCDDRKIHFISDEIYAMSRFDSPDIPTPTPFVSALQLNVESFGCDLSRVHVIWGLSKDLGSNGLRMGCCVTQANKPLATGLALSSNTQLSSLTALVTTHLLASPTLPQLFALSSQRLAEAYKYITTWLKQRNIPFIPANMGCFVFAQVAPNADTWESEANVIQAWKTAGVSVSPGKGYHVPETAKGWARINFALAPTDLAEALRRLNSVVSKRIDEQASVHDTDEKAS